MTDVLRRKRYVDGQVLMKTERILNAQFKGAILQVTGAQLEILRNLMMYPNRRESFVSEYHSQYYLMPTDSEWDNLLAIVASLEEELMLIYVDDYVCVRDKKAQSTVGGTFSSGDWRQRDVNEEQSDESNICSVTANQITLSPGTYRCIIQCPAYAVNQHQARLYNSTLYAEELIGSNAHADPLYDGFSLAFVRGRFVLAQQCILEIQHQCTNTKVDYGFGTPCNYADEIYTIAEFWRMIG